VTTPPRLTRCTGVSMTGTLPAAAAPAPRSAQGQHGSRACVAVITLARALGRADALRDLAEKEAANDNDARRDLRPL
jgi:predicted secreted protein